MTKRTIALAGNPNCGKTTLFNALTGANQRVGNWSGVTVERKEGSYRDRGWHVAIVDLPGVYSLDATDTETGLDETIARNYLLSGEAELIVNIVDASNLERNLYLTTQILEMRLPMVVALNMMDIAQQNLRIELGILAQRLGCPVVPIVAKRAEGLEELREKIYQQLQKLTKPHTYVAYPPVVEDAIAQLVPLVMQHSHDRVVDPRWNAIKLLEYESIAPELRGQELYKLIVENRRKIHQVLSEDIDILVADSRYEFVRRLIQGAAERTRQVSSSVSDKIDRVVLNRWLGIPIFLALMYVMFMLTINVGSAFIDFFDIFTGTILVDGFGEWLAQIGSPEWLKILLAHGVGGGIQTVATFIPIIGLLFLFLSILEDSGYMARAAFVMDRFMRFVGLPGKSFVPMLVGFGCNVPAIMATRTLENRRDRLLTVMMNPFMSCGARLPVYALFAAAFFPIGGQNVVFGLYLIGIAMAVFTGLVLKNTLLRGEASPFIMELPPYHVPQLKGVLLRTWDRLKAFMLRAGKVIVLMVMVLSLLNSVGTNGSFSNEDSEQSVLSSMSRSITPVFAPMGIRQDNWAATVGIFTGVFAKEAVVGTLDSLYGQLAQATDVAEEAFDFWGGIREAFASIPANLAELPNTLLDPLGISIGDVSSLSAAAQEQEVTTGTFGEMARRFDGKVGAFAYLLFVLLYFPCVAATGAIFRETNLGWTTFAAVWTTGLAYWAAVLFYQVATFTRNPGTSIAWIIGLAIAMAIALVSLKLVRPARIKQFRFKADANR
ncbi:Fe(2+) transporter permease subunit FeoB [Gloeocapsopsis crepidinum LEGE 06123]|uniref:Ferrous iron transport protein B n=1 Tax=Gloeocapsopsis crepidinum LEGE 06123 TaxID=588587 RepID=A0ABR9UNU1_9CHRO|nr:Fe(2+) transporter permease subunit FeoB [Gloeocapsopsis crepidinum]MBE9189695.1 Fe(2+) transporter permease subunit FeoB [Gloeocapsopsis crepidinum LEGE 06123]